MKMVTFTRSRTAEEVEVVAVQRREEKEGRDGGELHFDERLLGIDRFDSKVSLNTVQFRGRPDAVFLENLVQISEITFEGGKAASERELSTTRRDSSSIVGLSATLLLLSSVVCC